MIPDKEQIIVFWMPIKPEMIGIITEAILRFYNRQHTPETEEFYGVIKNMSIRTNEEAVKESGNDSLPASYYLATWYSVNDRYENFKKTRLYLRTNSAFFDKLLQDLMQLHQA